MRDGPKFKMWGGVKFGSPWPSAPNLTRGQMLNSDSARDAPKFNITGGVKLRSQCPAAPDLTFRGVRFGDAVRNLGGRRRPATVRVSQKGGLWKWEPSLSARVPNTQCPIHNTQCRIPQRPMPNTQYLIPNTAQRPTPNA